MLVDDGEGEKTAGRHSLLPEDLCSLDGDPLVGHCGGCFCHHDHIPNSAKQSTCIPLQECMLCTGPMVDEACGLVEIARR